MKISEISHPLSTFIATVRVVLPHTYIKARTIALADNFMSAKTILAKTYGANNVLSVSQITQECVIDETTKTLSAAELQVKSSHATQALHSTFITSNQFKQCRA